MITVILPAHLRTLAKSGKEVQVEVPEPATIEGVIDALEHDYPGLKGTIRDLYTGKRRPLVRFFASEQDLSHEPLSFHLPEEVASGKEPFWIVGAIAGG